MSRLRFGFALALLVVAAPLGAQSGGAYTVTRHTIDAGGGRSASAAYEIVGTIGQSEPQAAATGGAYRVSGGFWVSTATAPPDDAVFSNGFE